MDNVFVISGIISIVYFIAKFVEMRYIERESKPLEFWIRDSLLVYFSVICGSFILEQVKPILQQPNDGAFVTPVFTDNPEF